MSQKVTKSKNFNDRKRPFHEMKHQNGSKRFKSNGSSGQYGQHKNQNHQTSVKKEKGMCDICYQEHLSRKCPELFKLGLAKRKEKIREKGLCYKCPSSDHGLKTCKFGACPRCNKQHGMVLCPENPNNRHVNVTKKSQHKRNGKSKPITPKQ